MRILHLVHQYMPEYVGGTELYTRWLAEGLSGRGHQNSVFYRIPGGDECLFTRADAQGVRVWAAGSGEVTPRRRFLATFGDAYLLTAFRETLAKENPDIVHLQHLMGLPVSLVDELARRKIPYVVTLHDYWWVCANAQLITNYDQSVCDGPRAYWNCARCALARAEKPKWFPALPPLAGALARRNSLLRRVLAGAAKIIAPTRFVADWHVRRGVLAKKMLVIPHGLPLPKSFSAVSGQPFDRLRTGGAAVKFAYIGGLSWQKGVHILIEAFNGLPGNVELWIIGDEAADPDYVAALKQSAPGRVRFWGKLSREAVWQTLAQVDVAVTPALWYESFSFIVSEAFAAGVPVIASRIGALAERVTDGVNGLLTPPGDAEALRRALRRFVDEPDLRTQLRRGIPPVKGIEEYIAEMENLYRAILNSV